MKGIKMEKIALGLFLFNIALFAYIGEWYTAAAWLAASIAQWQYVECKKYLNIAMDILEPALEELNKTGDKL